jgi:hypothetical protein
MLVLDLIFAQEEFLATLQVVLPMMMLGNGQFNLMAELTEHVFMTLCLTVGLFFLTVILISLESRRIP